MKTFVTFMWHQEGYRSEYKAEHVNILYRMIKRNYHGEFVLVLITDKPKGVDPSIWCVPLWGDFSDIPSPHGTSFPSCYRRLKIFSSWAKQALGEDLVLLDLDCVIIKDITPIVNRNVEFMAWGGTNRGGGYNCSLVLHKAGTRQRIWKTFNPKTSPQRAFKNGFVGTDQGWITLCLGKGIEPTFTTEDGVYSYRNDIAPNNGILPENARIVFFHGKVDPWSPEAQRLEWVRQNYR